MSEKHTEPFLEKVYDKNPGILFTTIEEELFLVPTNNNLADLQNIFTASEVGALIWNNLDGEKMLSHIAELVVSEFDVAKKIAESHLIEFIKQLEKNELIEIIERNAD